MRSALVDYFQGDAYGRGEPFRGEGYECEQLQEIGASVLQHRQSGIRVSELAVDIRSGGPFRVVFHYTTRVGIANIMNHAKKDNEIFASLEERLSHFGKGIYAAKKCPAQFGNMEAVLVNNYWPRCGDPEEPQEHESNLLLRGGGVGSRPDDPRNSRVRSAILQNENRRLCAEFCIPLLVDEAQAHDIWVRAAPDLQVPLGCNRWREPQWQGRDIQVVVVQEGGGGAAPVDRRVAAMQQRLTYQQEALGRDHPDALLALGNLAATLSALGRDAEAEPLERRCLEASERTLGRDHPSTLIALGNLAATLGALGRDAEAEPLKRRRLEASERTLGRDHPSTLRALGNLAATLRKLGRGAEAERL